MEEVSFFEIKKRVESVVTSGAKWHFHILNPRCMFNGRPQYAFILENTSENKAYIHYSVAPQNELGEDLAKRLHGSSVTNENNTSEVALNEVEQELVKHAQELNKESKEWHHHVLPPDCILSQNKDKWTFVFEGEDANDIQKMEYKVKPDCLDRKFTELQ